MQRERFNSAINLSRDKICCAKNCKLYLGGNVVNWNQVKVSEIDTNFSTSILTEYFLPKCRDNPQNHPYILWYSEICGWFNVKSKNLIIDKFP